MSNWESMSALLETIPDLDGAACRGRSDLFDRTDAGQHAAGRLSKTEVHDARREALRLCRRCPTLGPCRIWLDALPVAHRPTGVVAGLVLTTAGAPSKIATAATLGLPGAL
ncbi:hypothetical protein MARA_18470 [Mycolicibacterium arabiense]|uniref:4Fe-4S Wbl-type domain-containing protein n=1 Tax=Mycolicibacterium arabiense TaxID=1286181 RepID=A0A7I7RWT5_9MYCO|nr:hypothetical protein [Mycolicibacterium arabiense]MCV7375234.1 hypothetical protein [Mycolicibacterium arabiense]BBY48379.1 hypothetical protein MARA_18470 [Mycolicibacterium arabiense]